MTNPFRPYEPSSVQTRSSLETAPRRSSKTRRSRRRAPRTVTTSWPASRKARAIGSMGAAPMPPATHATVPRKSSGLPGTPMCVGLPRGPATLAKESPSPKASVISMVVFPTACTTRVMVPASRSTSAIVSGMRSELAWGRTITNWPGRWRRATRGASISKRVTFSPRGFLTRIRNTFTSRGIDRRIPGAPPADANASLSPAGAVSGGPPGGPQAVRRSGRLPTIPRRASTRSR